MDFFVEIIGRMRSKRNSSIDTTTNDKYLDTLTSNYFYDVD